MNIVESKLKFKFELEKRKDTRFVVLHHAESSKCSIEDIHSWHLQNEWAGCGYHFFIRKDGSIYRGRPLDTIGAHAQGYNDASIGTCFEGNFEKEQMTEAQKQSAIQLLLDIRKQYSNVRIVRHKDVNSTACPGKTFDDNIIIEAMQDVDAVADDGLKNCLDLLVNADIINSPQYWLDNARAGKMVKGEYAKALIEATANWMYSNTGYFTK